MPTAKGTDADTPVSAPPCLRVSLMLGMKNLASGNPTSYSGNLRPIIISARGRFYPGSSLRYCVLSPYVLEVELQKMSVGIPCLPWCFERHPSETGSIPNYSDRLT